MAKANYSHNPEYPEAFVKIMCPGCDNYHYILVQSNVPGYEGKGPWGWNKSFESPTFTPSLLVRTGKYFVPEYFEKLTGEEREFYEENSTICHSFITDGRIQFLGDCTHSLANQTVELPELE